MIDSIEGFVSKLQTDGVEAGKREAAEIRSQAEEEARRIIEQANVRAAELVSRGEAEAQRTLSRAQTEMRLAARDSVLRLRDALSAMLRMILQTEVEEPLGEADFLKKLLHDVVMRYAEADVAGKEAMVINVPEDMHHKLAQWAIHELREALKDSGLHFQMHGTLGETGFEYRVTDGTVEVTVSSLVDVLIGMVGPHLREALEDAAKGEKSEVEQEKCEVRA
jgi:V/A-type H+/Na+-transporting ATPase subunit E